MFSPGSRYPRCLMMLLQCGFIMNSFLIILAWLCMSSFRFRDAQLVKRHVRSRGQLTVRAVLDSSAPTAQTDYQFYPMYWLGNIYQGLNNNYNNNISSSVSSYCNLWGLIMRLESLRCLTMLSWVHPWVVNVTKPCVCWPDNLFLCWFLPHELSMAY